ncbi:hypothetical protein GCM10009411_09340 [Shewanella litoralis]|uniref:Uncharacterized protein n=1 Tax=Shewanella litoralis TaxID=2282700 RepID=A0ABQ2R2T5_9GAMM|nr:hypothetical protein GCM10009411_09340 [Shewanella litoralis]
MQNKTQLKQADNFKLTHILKKNHEIQNTLTVWGNALKWGAKCTIKGLLLLYIIYTSASQHN